MNLKEIATHSDVNYTHLSEEFTTHLKMNITTYICKKRVEHAKLLLKDTVLPINIIANKVGYSDIRYFRKRFKDITGETPTKYRVKCS